MEQNKVRTYLLYAVGEIALVMIGILLALQVNNWNEQKNDRKFETTMLREIVNSLASDSILIADYLEPRVIIKERAIDTLLNLGGVGSGMSNEQIIDLYERSNTRFNYSFNSGPYETIKSNGLDIISNDTLRARITRAYEVTFPVRQKFILNPIMEYNDELLVLEKEFLGLDYIRTSKLAWELALVAGSDDVLNSPSFKRALYLQKDMALRYRSSLEFLKKTKAFLKNEIRLELKSRGEL